MDLLHRLFDPSGFPARWDCGSGWRETPWLGWLHIASDLAVWGAYVAIPIVLVTFLLRRRDLPFRLIFLLFGAFILACGTTHLMEAILFWHPLYRLSGLIKLITALVSWATVGALFRVVPVALAMRTPEELEREVAARQRAELSLQKANAELEGRVQELVRRDIAERKQALTRLTEQEERLRLAIEATGLGIFDVSILTGKMAWSERCGEIWGLPADAQPVSQLLLDAVHPEDRQRADQVTAASLDPRGSGSFVLEHRIVRPNGHVRWVLARGTTIFDDERRPVRSLGTVLDVTERKMAEEALRQSEIREKERASELEAVLRAAPTPIWISHDRQCGEVTGNPASYQLLSMPEESNVSASPPAPIARTFREYRDGVPVPSAELPLQRAAALGIDVQDAELTLVFNDNHVRHIYGNATPLRDRDGVVRGAVGAFMDITELKKIESDLKDADRRKDEFLAILSHELRNPLAPMRNSLEVMKQARGNAELIEKSRTIMERQMGQMVRLIDDLLDVSRINRNKLELRRERVELASILHHVIEACRPMADAARHELHLALPAEPIYLDADPVRLSQIFGNLVTNACKYTPSEGKVWLNVQRQAGDVIIRVKDTGIGIPADLLPKVFEMFTQLDRSLERTQGGLGIGLTLVKRLVEMHSGMVTAHSEGSGQGSEFVVRLPILPAAPMFVAEPQRPMMQGKTRRMLVVDDNEDAALTLAVLLRMSGNQVQTAHDGVQALEVAQDARPDVILLDIGMPKMNGYAVCRALRTQPWGQNILIVALTGWGQEEDRRKSKDAGFDGHLVKPVDYAELLKLLAEFEASSQTLS